VSEEVGSSTTANWQNEKMREDLPVYVDIQLLRFQILLEGDRLCQLIHSLVLLRR
jgi:hypothetical protein